MTSDEILGEDIAEALEDGRLEPRSGALAVGVIRKSDSRDHVLFSQVGPADWIEIPTAMIRSARRVGALRHGGRTDPVVLLQLAPAQDPGAQVAYQLLNQLTSVPRPDPAEKASPSTSRSGCPCKDEPSSSQGGATFISRQIGAGGLGASPLGGGSLGITISDCYPCTRCWPFTDDCWESTCYDIVGSI